MHQFYGECNEIKENEMDSDFLMFDARIEHFLKILNSFKQKSDEPFETPGVQILLYWRFLNINIYHHLYVTNWNFKLTVQYFEWGF